MNSPKPKPKPKLKHVFLAETLSLIEALRQGERWISDISYYIQNIGQQLPNTYIPINPDNVYPILANTESVRHPNFEHRTLYIVAKDTETNIIYEVLTEIWIYDSELYGDKEPEIEITITITIVGVKKLFVTYNSEKGIVEVDDNEYPKE